MEHSMEDGTLGGRRLRYSLMRPADGGSTVEPPIVDYGKLQVAIETELDLAGLQKVPSIIKKCIQCYESKLTRHGNMLE